MGEVIKLADRIKFVRVEYTCNTCKTTTYEKVKESETKMLKFKPKICPTCGCCCYYTIGERLN